MKIYFVYIEYVFWSCMDGGHVVDEASGCRKMVQEVDCEATWKDTWKMWRVLKHQWGHSVGLRSCVVHNRRFGRPRTSFEIVNGTESRLAY